MCHQKVRISKCTKFRKNISIHGWVITTSGLGKRTAVILKIYFRFWLWPTIRYRHLILQQISCESDWRRPSYDVMPIFKMADVSHVVFSVRQWWTTHDVSLMVWVLSFGLIRCMVSEILQFLDFGNWVGLQMPIDAPFGGFWGHIVTKWCHSSSQPENGHPWAEPRHLSHKAWISVARFELGVGPREKKTIQDSTRKSQMGYISRIWGQVPSKQCI